MALLTGAALQGVVDRYYAEAVEKEKQYNLERKTGLMAQAHRYESIADTLKASAGLYDLGLMEQTYHALLSTVGNRTRLVRKAFAAEGVTAAYRMAMELLGMIEDMAQREGRIEKVSLGEAKVEEGE